MSVDLRRPPTDQEYFTIADAARHCGLTEAAIRCRVQARTLPASRLGRRVLIPREALDQLIRGLF